MVIKYKNNGRYKLHIKQSKIDKTSKQMAGLEMVLLLLLYTVIFDAKRLLDFEDAYVS